MKVHGIQVKFNGGPSMAVKFSEPIVVPVAFRIFQMFDRHLLEMEKELRAAGEKSVDEGQVKA